MSFQLRKKVMEQRKKSSKIGQEQKTLRSSTASVPVFGVILVRIFPAFPHIRIDSYSLVLHNFWLL